MPEWASFILLVLANDSTNRLGSPEELALGSGDVRRDLVRAAVDRRVAVVLGAELRMVENAVKDANRMYLIAATVALGVALAAAHAPLNVVEPREASLPVANPAAMLDPDPLAIAVDFLALANMHKFGFAHCFGDANGLVITIVVAVRLAHPFAMAERAGVGQLAFDDHKAARAERVAAFLRLVIAHRRGVVRRAGGGGERHQGGEEEEDGKLHGWKRRDRADRGDDER